MDITDIEIAEDGRALVMRTGGRCRRLGAGLLWSECPSAQGRVRRLRGAHTAPHALAIVSIRGIGAYGVNIAFSDGHDRGIYPWGYLAALAARPQPDDFLSD